VPKFGAHSGIPGDVKAFTDFGFDNLKIDGCSAQHDIKQWAELINKTGTLAEIENCNNGANPTIPVAEGGCPYYHQYRSSGDINNGYPSWVANAQTVARCVTGSFLFLPFCFSSFAPVLLELSDGALAPLVGRGLRCDLPYRHPRRLLEASNKHP